MKPTLSIPALAILAACAPGPNGAYWTGQAPVTRPATGSALASDIQVRGPRLECRQHRWDSCDDAPRAAVAIDPPEPPCGADCDPPPPPPPTCRGNCPPPPPPDICKRCAPKPNAGGGNGPEIVDGKDIDPGQSGYQTAAGND